MCTGSWGVWEDILEEVTAGSLACGFLLSANRVWDVLGVISIPVP